MIHSRDISVVVQGPVDNIITPKCLKSIRKHLPEAEIILSTWEGSTVEGMDYDIVIFNKDPSVFNYTLTNGTIGPNNINRQILSTQSGLKQCSRKYSFKLRSDLVFTQSTFLKYFDMFEKRNPQYSFFKHKVIIPTIFSKLISRETMKPVPFHPSDWWFFGLSEDIKMYFLNTPFDIEEKSILEKYKYPEYQQYTKFTSRFFPEQYLFLNAFKQKFAIDYEDLSCWNYDKLLLSERLLFNNFIILDFVQHGIYSEKYNDFTINHAHSSKKDYPGLIYFSDFEDKYIEHCVSTTQHLISFKNKSNYWIKMIIPKLYRKQRYGDQRTITFLGFKFSYTRRARYLADINKIRLIEIEIYSFCNRRCWFCPNSFIDRHSNNILMDENLYLGIINELKSINYKGVISYSRYNEPLAYKDIFIKRLTKARELIPEATLHTNTNGDYLNNRQYLDELYEAGLRSLNIQYYLNENEIFDINIIKKGIQKTAEKLELDYDVKVDSQERYEVAFLYKDMNIRMYARDFRINGNNRGGSLDTIAPIKHKAPCFIPYTDIYVDYNGKVLPCCNLRSDNKNHQAFILGDVNQAPLLQIFNSKKTQEFRKNVSRKNIKIAPCNECNFFSGCTKPQ